MRGHLARKSRCRGTACAGNGESKSEEVGGEGDHDSGVGEVGGRCE